MKTCTACGESKALDSFAVRASGRQAGQLYARCRPCTATAARAWEQRNRERYKQLKREHHERRGRDTVFKKKYGITVAERDALVEKQGGKCAGCLAAFTETATPRIDHSHLDGHVRGLLCHQCNVALGLLKDDPDRLRRLADYLEER